LLFTILLKKIEGKNLRLKVFDSHPDDDLPDDLIFSADFPEDLVLTAGSLYTIAVENPAVVNVVHEVKSDAGFIRQSDVDLMDDVSGNVILPNRGTVILYKLDGDNEKAADIVWYETSTHRLDEACAEPDEPDPKEGDADYEEPLDTATTKSWQED
jgi:hypothetical protein